VTWMDNKGIKTSCGSFKIDIAYIHDVKSTLLSNNDYLHISNKLDKISGLYIYKDGLRILPYGDSDIDFLDIELRRNKSAGYYFFSYRRLFGAVSLRRNNNSELVEKAGREGFRENKAYKQFREILKNFFVQMAADFFRDTERWGNQAGPLSEFWTKKRVEVQKRNILLKAQEKKSKARKQKFQNELENFFVQVRANKPQSDIENILKNTQIRLEYISNINDIDFLADEVYRNEKEIRKELFDIRLRYRVVKPNGIALSKELAYDYEAFQNRYAELELVYFKPAEIKIESSLTDYAKDHKIDRRKRLVVSLENTIEEYKKVTISETSETRKSVENISSKILQLTKDIGKDYEEKVRVVKNELAHIEPSKITDENLVSERIRLENILIEESENAKDILDSIRYQLNNISTTKEYSDADINNAMEEELTLLRERIEADLELSQMGLAVGVIQHEFNSSVKSIQLQLRSLKAWADVNQGLQGIYDHIKLNFDHLNGYLRLFAPLNRRTNPTVVEIAGNDIYDFIKDIFFERISEKGREISIESTKRFNQKKILGFPSTFYPVFVNLVDNAIFWLKDQPSPKIIQFDADESGFYISNNGPEIEIRKHEIIFEAGYSGKPNGTGLGLYISREVLRKVGYDIILETPKLNMNVTFRIHLIK